MPTKRPSWEGSILVFAFLFTILLGGSYELAPVLKIGIPIVWVLLASVLITLGLRYISRPPAS